MRWVSVILLAVQGAFATVYAQQDVLEYKMDIGGGLGLCYYWGDANASPFRGASVAAMVSLRRNFNPRMGVKFNLAYGNFSGSSKGYFLPEEVGSTVPAGVVSFRSNVIDLGAQFELNFWGYGLGPGYKKLSRITPYAVLVIGGTLGWNADGGCFGMNIPVGLGVKYKVRPRVNLIFEYTHRFSTTDRLDAAALNDPYFIKSGFLKNKDSYTFLMLCVTYDISPKYRKCNN